MSSIYYSAAARRDLEDIWEYIESDLANPDAAERMVSRIMDAVDRLQEFPEMGTPLEAIAPVGGGYRYIPVGSYLAFYRMLGDGVYVDRILYSRRNCIRILLGDVRPEA